MKKLLKILLTAFVLLIATTSIKAQELPVSIGIKGGVNFSNISTDGFKSKTGFNAGITVDLNLPSGVALMSGLEINTKGAKIEDTDFSRDAIYLQLPIHVGYRVSLPGIRFHFNFGPYFAQGIGGKTKGLDGVKYDTFGDNGLKKFDWGLGLGVGTTFLGRIQVRIGYDHGLANIGRNDVKVRNRNAYASVGFLFF